MKANLVKCLVLVMALVLLLCGCGQGAYESTHSLDGIVVTMHTDKDAYSGGSTAVVDMDIVNNTGTVLPSTGAKGTMMLIMGCAMLVTVAAVFMITRKKMSIYED